MSAERVVVISDIHLGIGNDLAIFHAEDALCKFLDYHAALIDSIDLVILGDALDYLQVSPYLCFKEDVAKSKTAAIVSHHLPVFQALQRFIKPQAGLGRKRIIWAIGNHDLELQFNQARQEIEKVVLGDSASKDALRWILSGDHLDYHLKNNAKIRLVHGNKHDLWNAIDYEHTQKIADQGGDKDFRYPPGSILVADVLNPLKQGGYKHIDLLKPETTVALPLCLALWPDDTNKLLEKALTPLGGWGKSRLKQAFSTQKPVFDGNRQKAAPTLPTSGAELLARTLQATLSKNDDLALQDDDLPLWLCASDLNASVTDFIEKPAIKDFATDFRKRAFGALLRGAAKRLNGSSKAFDLEEPDDNDLPIKNSFSDQVILVVAGHSHLARAVSYRGGYYINTGTWADLMRLPRLPDNEYAIYARELREMFTENGSMPAAYSPYQRLTYADIDLRPQADGRSFAASLAQWPHAPTLSLCKFP